MSTNKSDSGGFKPFLLLTTLSGAVVFFATASHQAKSETTYCGNQALAESGAHKDTADSFNAASPTLTRIDSLANTTLDKLAFAEVKSAQSQVNEQPTIQRLHVLKGLGSILTLAVVITFFDLKLHPRLRRISFGHKAHRRVV